MFVHNYICSSTLVDQFNWTSLNFECWKGQTLIEALKNPAFAVSFGFNEFGSHLHNDMKGFILAHKNGFKFSSCYPGKEHYIISSLDNLDSVLNFAKNGEFGPNYQLGYEFLTRVEMIDKIYSYVGEENIVAMYPYGSRVYGNAKGNSDHDFIVVHNSDFPNQEVVYRDMNVHFYDVKTFQQALDDHEIWALECYFLPKDTIIRDTNIFTFTLDKSKLRVNVSSKASNSFVKMKKKLIDGETYIGQKSLFHSLRMIMFGISIATEGKIDFSIANKYFYDIINYDDWEILKAKYQPIYNELSTEFRVVAPK